MKEDHHQLSIYGFREAVKLNSRILIRVCIACYIRLKKYQFLSKNEKDVLKDTGDSRQFKILRKAQGLEEPGISKSQDAEQIKLEKLVSNCLWDDWISSTTAGTGRT